MSFPIFRLTSEEVAVIYAILDKHPDAMGYKYEFKKSIFHWSISVKGLVKDLIGAHP